jgi:hypothetical protein
MGARWEATSPFFLVAPWPLGRRILDVFGGLNVGRRDGRREILVLVLLFYGNG